MTRQATTIGLTALVLGGLAATMLVGRRPRREAPMPLRKKVPDAVPAGRQAAPARATASRRLDQAAAILGSAVLLDSGMEHYRGSFQNRAMYVPLGVSGLTILAGLGGSRAGALRGPAYALAGLTGLLGLGFHAYNIAKRPSGLSWLNLFYAAPVGAPAALSLAGLLGSCAQQVRELEERRAPAAEFRAMARGIAAIAALGIAGTVGEAWLLHFRGAFQNPAMFLPVTIPPVAAVMLAGLAADRPVTSPDMVRVGLLATAALGVMGVGFHAYGVQRMMGGWRNWSQNLLSGPPLPAPPSYTGFAIGGLAALALHEEAGHA